MVNYWSNLDFRKFSVLCVRQSQNQNIENGRNLRGDLVQDIIDDRRYRIGHLIGPGLSAKGSATLLGIDTIQNC